jgi:hypothetical protein
LNNAQYVILEGTSPDDGPHIDLIVGDVYWAAPVLERGMWRVWDLSGEDYLYPKRYFELAADE